MGRTAIAWADWTWNPWTGCTRVSRGCEHCYMYRAKRRWGQDPTRVTRSRPATFNLPLGRTENGTWKIAPGSRVFVCSWSDFFHEAADKWRREAYGIMLCRRGLDFLIPTKRPERISACVPSDEGRYGRLWLGVSVEDQESADERVPKLLAADWPGVNWLSAEPLLGPLDLRLWLGSGLRWVVVGGESGPDARPMGIEWVHSIRKQCREAGVPLFIKQDCGPRPGMQGRLPDDLWALKELPLAVPVAENTLGWAMEKP